MSLSHSTFIIKDYIVEVNKKNETDTIQFVTTGDFVIRNIKTDVVLPEAVPPTNNIDIPYCIANQKNAICIDENVLNSNKSIFCSNLNLRLSVEIRFKIIWDFTEP